MQWRRCPHRQNANPKTAGEDTGGTEASHCRATFAAYDPAVMGRLPRGHLRLVIAIILVGVGIPLAMYWLLVGRAPGISVWDARRLTDDKAASLVDVRDSTSANAPLDGAIRWSFTSIRQAHSPADIPDELRGRPMLLMCPAGVSSAQAAMHLRRIGVADVFSVRGGMQEWIAAVPGCPSGVLLRSNPVIDANVPSLRPSPPYEQWAAVLTFLGVKFIYSILSAAIVVALWRRTEPDLAALRWSMIFFFIGEAFCFINVMAFAEHSFLLEHLHSVGMVLSLAYATYALLEGMDARLIHFSDEARCAATGLCRGCIKHAPVGCGLRRLFLLLIPATALTAAIPLFSSFRHTAYNTWIFGVLHSYRHPIIHQVYELRYLPITAIVLLCACFLVLLLCEQHPVPLSKILFSAAVGAMGFSFFRLVLVSAFVDNQVWFAAWEETTELLYIGVVGGVLIVFGRGLLGPQPISMPVHQ